MSNLTPQRPGRSERPASLLPEEPSGRRVKIRQPKGRVEALSRKEETYRSFYEHDHQAPSARRRRKHPFLWLLVSLAAILGTAVTAVAVAPQVLGFKWEDLGVPLPTLAFADGQVLRYDENGLADLDADLALTQAQTIYPGVTIDGVDVSGMTVEEAEAAVWARAEAVTGEIALTLQIDNQVWQVDKSRVPLYRNVQEQVQAAYAMGRKNTTTLRGSGRTPLQERAIAIREMAEQPTHLTTKITYDQEAVRQIAEEAAAAMTYAPINADVTDFNVATKRFAFSDEVSGRTIDAQEIYAALIQRLDAGSYQGQVTLSTREVPAQTTRTALEAQMVKVSSFTTNTTSNKNRNTNIDLACQAINGLRVDPGETFSFNKATGERTAKKGYKEATAISGGQTRPEVGGGVCQTSSTLFNAVARANLEIVSRSPHAWPSSYVKKGMDATVNWPGLDFKFRNNTDWPVYIVARYADRKCTVEIYGRTLGEGITIDLESEVVRTLEPPTEVKRVQNTSLPAGTETTTVKARTGYIVRTYQCWYQGKTLIDRKLLCESTYKAYQETVEYN